MANKCGKCDTNVNDTSELPKCSLCLKIFHFECSGLKEATWRKMAWEKKSSWRCPHYCSSKSPQVSGPDLTQTVLDINTKLNEIWKELRDLTSSQTMLSEKYDDILTELKNERATNKLRDQKMLKLEQENADLRSELASISLRVNEMDQYSRNRNVEIHGIAERPQESLRDLMEELAKQIQIDTKPEEIDVIHRIPTRNPNKKKPVIVQFTTRTAREKWLQKRNTGLTSNNIISGSDDTLIYINENLCEGKRKLAFEARTAKKNLNYKYMWIKSATIFMKKDDGCPVIKVKSSSDIPKQ